MPTKASLYDYQIFIYLPDDLGMDFAKSGPCGLGLKTY